ncbi:hypothetical protein MMC31_003183 [Peltigera leucophlebia]|nr:hypothetical protein [Peltigera leucophlebia]
MINLLLDSGAHVTPTVVRALADPKNSNYDNETFKAILQSLLDHGWDVNMILQSLQTSDATLMRNEVPFNFLLAHGADPNVTDRYHYTPLSVAARDGSLSYIELLFSHGAKPDHNALHMAIRRPQSDSSRFPILALLLSHGADINALETGMKGRPTSSALAGPPHQSTVLFKALSAKDVEMVKFLIEQGADPKVKNQWGEEEGLSSLEAVELSKNEKIRHAVLGEANSKVKEPA